MSFVFVHTARGGGRNGRAARGGGASARQRTSARGEGRGGACGGPGRGRAFPPLCVIGWRAARGGAACVGESLGVSHLSIVFAAFAAPPPPLSNASAASCLLSSSRRRRGVSFSVCPLSWGRAPLAVGLVAGHGGHPQPPGLDPQTFWRRNGDGERVSLPRAAAAAPPSLRLSPAVALPRRRACLPPAPRAPLSSVKSRPPPLPGTPDHHHVPREPLNCRLRVPGPSFSGAKG